MRGEIEQRMRAHPPEARNFTDCNWKKRKARFVSDTAKVKIHRNIELVHPFKMVLHC